MKERDKICYFNLKIFFRRPLKHLGERTTTIFIKNTPFVPEVSGFSIVYEERVSLVTFFTIY